MHSFSFSGCSWLMTYHIGVGKYLQEYYDTRKMSFAGASSGSVTALGMALNWKMDALFDFTYLCAVEANQHFLGPIGRMSDYLSQGLSNFLATSSYKTASERLYISVTELPSFKNKIITGTDINSNEDLLKMIMASCFIPIYYSKPIIHKRRIYVDGGLTNNCPVIDENTITVSPNPALNTTPIDIFPNQPPPIRMAIFPNLANMRSLYSRGYQDCQNYLKNNSAVK